MVPESIQVLSTVRDLFLKFTEKNTFFPLITSPVHFPLAGKYSLHIIFFFSSVFIFCVNWTETTLFWKKVFLLEAFLQRSVKEGTSLHN